MIIQSINAINFRKYKHLDIDTIPDKGLIIISGENESGKSSIADALCFALFGRTFHIDESNATKLIAWKEKSATVTLNFIHKNKAYQLTRTVHKAGKIDVELLSQQKDVDDDDDDDDKDKIITDNPQKTQTALQQILGYNYATFSDSYYLVQRELSTPHPNSDSIKDMVGIRAYSQIINECRHASDKNEELLTTLHPQYEENHENLQLLSIDDTWLPELVDTRDTVEVDQTDKRTLVNQLRVSADKYAQDRESFITANHTRKTLYILSGLLLAALVVALGLWAFIELTPQTAEKLLMPDATNNTVTLNIWAEKWMPLLTATIAILFWVCLLLKWRIEDKQLIPLKKSAQQYAETLWESYQQVRQVPGAAFASRSLDFIAQARGGSLPVIKLDHQHLAKLHTLTAKVMEFHNTANNDTTEQLVVSLRTQMKTQQQHNKAYLEILTSEIDAEMDRTTIAAGFRKTLAELDVKIRQQSRHIQVQSMAIELLHRSAQELTKNFNRSITQTSGEILPSFTRGRYDSVKIDDDLNVTVFSKEKNDLMDFDEISSGTQRQIMLALRIAMSEELAKSDGNNAQFIILDEPFAFFDHERTVETLEKLPLVSNIISQIWVASQEFPEDTIADKEIRCHTHKDELHA